MTRTLKTLGLALVAMLTMGIAASSAMAVQDEFHSETAPTELTGGQVGTNTFTTDSGTFHCTTETITASTSTTTTSAIEATPTTSGCRSTGFIEANITWDTNGCKFQITALTTTNNTIHMTGCNAGTAGMVTTAPFCTITITPQTFGNIHWFNEGSGATRDLRLEFTANTIAYHESGFACKNSGSSTTGGEIAGSITITGENPTTKAHHGIWIG